MKNFLSCLLLGIIFSFHLLAKEEKATKNISSALIKDKVTKAATPASDPAKKGNPAKVDLPLAQETPIKLASLHSEEFFIPPYLKDKVDFWYKVYSFWDSNQVIFHDREDLSVVYHVLDLPKIPGELSSFKFFSEVLKTKDDIKAILVAIQSGKEPENKSLMYENIKAKVQKLALDESVDLTTRLRHQSGLKSQFELGLSISGRHFDEMTLFLEKENLPKELISIVFVESLFYSGAVSSAGASGFWGIMRSTAPSLGIYVNNLVDERLDPLLSTKAAANYLKKSIEGLKTWPLAVTSYNYGYAGVARACTNLETQDLGKIIDEHQSPIFGFAVKNYFASVLAAKMVLSNYHTIFPTLKREAAWTYEVVEILRPLLLTDVFTYKGATRAEISKLNPALTTKALNGKEALPPGFSLRVPKGGSTLFHAALKKIPEKQRASTGLLVSTRYKSSGKETLALIAKKHAISLDFLLNRFNKEAHYKPKGVVVIRSISHLFNSLKEAVAKLELTQK